MAWPTRASRRPMLCPLADIDGVDPVNSGRFDTGRLSSVAAWLVPGVGLVAVVLLYSLDF